MVNDIVNACLLEATYLLGESSGANGLRRRMEVEKEKKVIDSANSEIDKINKIKEGTRSKNKLIEMNKNIKKLNSLGNMSEMKKSRSQKYLDNKGTESKKMIDKFGKDYALQKMKSRTDIDKSIAESRMRYHKLKNESISLLLSEATNLIDR